MITGAAPVKPLASPASLRHPVGVHHAKGVTMTTGTPEQNTPSEPEAQTPTPSPSSGNAGEVTAETPAQAESPEDADGAEIPSTEQLEEPSTEKEPSEEPKAPPRDEAEPDHHAVGIGVIDAPDPDA
ncbi:hypothetical protein AB663_001441 [Microbacterium sp. XT11]|nr:hypothetical protein AB663_001441 [Microbacterium sp. XT11]